MQNRVITAIRECSQSYDPNHYTDIVSKVNKTWLCQAFERGCKMLTSKAHERACIIYGFDRLNSNTGPT
jgi:hypothetical protein